MLNAFFWVGGALFWSIILLSLAVKATRRGPLKKVLQRPALYPWKVWVGFRYAGTMLALRQKRDPRISPVLVAGLRSAKLSDCEHLRDVLREVDQLPTIVKGKEALKLDSIFEISYRSVSHKKTPYTHKLQNPPYYLPGVPSKAFHDPRDYEWVPPLERAFPVIQRELRAVLATDGAGFKTYKNEFDNHLTGWNTFNFFFYGQKIEENCARCPETTRILESLPRFERDHIMFSALNPHSHIPPHYGPMNGIVRAHLPLVVPPGCYIKVGDLERTWEEGKVMVFDDSYLHQVWNHSDHVRIVLFLNFWDPCFSKEEIPVLERFREAYERTPYSRVHEANERAARTHDIPLPEKPAA
jgi:aspartyl/asparaginyl beta-hydroxylase (cupin superfamily)